MRATLIQQKRGFGRINYEGTTTKRFYPVSLELEIRQEPLLNLEIRQEHKTKRTIDLEPIAAYFEVSICGAFNGSFGQNLDTIARLYPLCQPDAEDRYELMEICSLWERWHLNGMKAGTRIQEAILKGAEAQFQFDPLSKEDSNARAFHRHNKSSHYDWAQAILDEAGYLEDRGYKYGSDWLVEPVPFEVLKKLADLFNCSTTKKLALVNAYYELHPEAVEETPSPEAVSEESLPINDDYDSGD